MTLPPGIQDPAAGSTPEPGWVNDPSCRRVDRFVLGPEIGRGGMGRVHFAWDPILKRLLALKLLPGGDPEQQLRLLREARNQAKLEHPNICRIHDLGMDGDRPYIVMQLILGPTLSDLRPELDARSIAGLMADVAGAIHAAHRAGLIHRDLKPANILVAGRGTGRLVPFVVDFGLARDLQALDQTLSWAVMGTPAFMSPEQARGEALGPATDLYSLGATLYAMLSGHPPYEGTTLGGLLDAQAEGGVRHLGRRVQGVPADLETITLKCLEADPAARYATAQALQEDLHRFLAGRPILARPTGPFGRLAKWARRKPALAMTGAAGIVTTLLLGGWNVRTVRQTRLREQTAQRFAMEIRDAEHLLRIERMLPLHDIRTAEARLRLRIDEIRKGIARMGRIAQGPGLYAVGRGHLALREHGQALLELKAAWEAGFQAPEVAYAIGSALLETYQERELRVGPAADPKASLAAARQELLDPGLRWLQRASGAKVDHPNLARALISNAEGRHEEADRLYDQTLEAAPWLFEAWIGKAKNHLAWKALTPGLGEADIDRAYAAVRAMLQRAQLLAPSDDTARLLEASSIMGQQMQHSARDRREEGPLQEAQRILDEVARIRPGALDILLQSTELALQRGFLQLSQGRDPAAMLLDRTRPLQALRQESGWRLDPKKNQGVATLHHLYWVIAEADWRFGRDPGPALAEARRAREAFPLPDQHFVFPLLVEARHRIERGLDPGPIFAEAEAILEGRFHQSQDDAFVHSIHGELVVEKARWLLRRDQDAEKEIERGIASIGRGLQREPRMAYLYYSLPVLHALRAQSAHAHGQDPALHLQRALQTARRGVDINPANAQLRLAAAEAWLAEARILQSRGTDCGRSLAEARRHLDAGDRVNPRDFRLMLVRAEVEWEQARALERAGRDPAAALERMRKVCGLGRRTKGDEPRFQDLAALALRPWAS